MLDLLGQLTQFLSAYFKDMSLMLTATILVVYGDLINSHVKRAISPYHFIVRCIVFVLLCAFGYGAMTLYAAPFVLYVIKYLPWHYQGLGFLLSFVLIGFLAERRRYM
ncbi:DUF3392 family protein [Bowmanella sp. JS7-9]|uniref:DUF3392 family protein n=1 Tax=Pseudobowmanella zhangzhouensis TaxID=1537679 RepID=A0ABW1XI83_9ALTE|nr:DUF3392 family protein [Bowmanella sp. JS7-9]TBX21389.1 hypothetical protein TK45_12635 [Bowmanella sp. JS7-9]